MTTMFRSASVLLLAAAVSIYSPTMSAVAQQLPQAFIVSRGTLDATVQAPLTSVQPGRKDAAALQELVNYVKVVGFTDWKSASGRGKMVRRSSDQDQTYLADMYILGVDSIRLDVHTDKGVESLTYARRLGQMISADGQKSSISTSAARNGLTTFLSIRTIELLQADATSIIDGGMFSIDSRSMHRISIAFPVYPLAHNPVFKKDQTIIDCYFDPQSHLLIKTAVWISENNSGPKTLLEITSFGDYRNVGGIMIPFAFQQTINGQKLWSLQLTDVRRDSGVDQSLFQF